MRALDKTFFSNYPYCMLKSLLYFLSLEYNPSARLLDLGAGNLWWTKKVAAKIGTKDIIGVDI